MGHHHLSSQTDTIATRLHHPRNFPNPSLHATSAILLQDKVSPLILAAYYGRAGCVKLLLETGANLAPKDKVRDTGP